MKPSLLILAAGMGSRYGGLKQMDGIGPSEEIIMDYSIFDAQRAGIQKIIFVIKKELEKDFKDVIIKKYKGKADIDYVIQDLSKIPSGIALDPNRVKPLGTAHAVLMGAEKIKGSFIVINADDFYGSNSFKVLADHLTGLTSDKKNEYALVGFSLKNTLSENGVVSRGVCEVDGQHYLKTVTEKTSIARTNGKLISNEVNSQVELDENTTVSMNMWGFTESVFPRLNSMLKTFLEANEESLTKEMYLPSCIDELIKINFAKVKVLKSDSEWFGLTYKEDRVSAVNRINKLIALGLYPNNLFG